MLNGGADGGEGSRMQLLLAVALVTIVIGGTADLVMDRPTTWLSFHVIFETLMIAGGLVMATALWLGWWRAERSVRALRQSLEERRQERDEWRSSAVQALDGLGRAINEQFAAWGLTPTEREVALYLLKGYTHKAIARRTDRSHQTVRQHAAVVYRKSGLSGRAQLSAFFLEDLMLPEGERGVVRRGPGEVHPPPRRRSAVEEHPQG